MSRCERCGNYGALHEPKVINDTCVYGFCFKNFCNLGSVYPVYIPDGGVCKSFAERKDGKEAYEYEMTQAFKCECCKKNLIEKISRLVRNCC